MSGRLNRWSVMAWTLWLVPLLVISVMVVVKPEDHTVTPVYHEAVDGWWQHHPLYNNKFYYCPQFTFLFGPFHLLARSAGDILWRLAGTVGIAAGVLLFCGAFPGQERNRAFFMVTVLTMPLCLQAIQFGQANVHLAAALLLAAWCLGTKRWWAATILLWLAVTIKPLGVAAMGLAWAAYPHLWWRLALGLPVFMIAPFGFGPATYVWNQYLACVENLRQSASVTEHRFADLNGLLRTFGMVLSGPASLFVRAVAGGLFMLLCRRAALRQPEPLRALAWLGAAAVFLMLFNPMTEANSYAVLAPALGLLAWWHFGHGARSVGWVLAAMVLSMGLLPEPLRPLFGNYFSLAWYPAMSLGFAGILAWTVFRTHPREPVSPLTAIERGSDRTGHRMNDNFPASPTN